MTEHRAQKFFEESGFKCEAEPDWIEEGQRPDFFCSGPESFWCEVKTFGPTEDFQNLSNAHEEIRRRAKKIALHGRGILWTSDKLDHRDAKFVMSLLGHSLSSFEDADAPERLLALVPKEPRYNEFVRFSMTTKDYSRVDIHSCVSATGKYGLPYNYIPEPYEQSSQLNFSSGDIEEVFTRNILPLTDDFRVAVEAWPENSKFDFLATMPTGVAKELNNPGRIRGAVAEANSQFKNAINYREAPCLLMIYHNAVDVPIDEVIKSALYGGLKFAFPIGKSQNGRFFFEEKWILE